jgi:hypothetical protein
VRRYPTQQGAGIVPPVPGGPVAGDLTMPISLSSIAGAVALLAISNCGCHCDDRSRPGLPSLRVGQVLRVTLRDAQSHVEEDDE